MKYKAVFVDLGGVLVLNRAQEIGKYFETQYGMDQNKTKDIFKFIQSGQKSDEEIDDFLKTMGVGKEVWREYLSKFIETETRNDDLFIILNEAQKQGTKIVYTSNNSASIGKILEKYQIDKLPDLIINSADAGVSKPDPAFWELSLKETSNKWPEIEKPEILVIDDSTLNYNSATSFGIDAILYTIQSNDEIKQKLEIPSTITQI